MSTPRYDLPPTPNATPILTPTPTPPPHPPHQKTTPLSKKPRKPTQTTPHQRYTRPPPPRATRPPRLRRRGNSADPRERPESTATASRRNQHRRQRRPAPLVYIDDPVACARATETLMTCGRVAVDCEGVQLSRSGRLCLLQVASDDCIFIFDLVGETEDWAGRFFEQGGLRQLLEAQHIWKVMHDCRHDSDALFHQFGVKLGPVLDTQVVFSVLRRVKGKVPGLPVSLKTLLKKFAGATEEELHMKNSIKDTMRGDDDFWLNRPLSATSLRYARLDVEYLLSITQLLHKYIDGADNKAWQIVISESQQYLIVFREDENGPRKAQQQYEQQARVARRQRVADDHTRRIQAHQLTDPMRKFSFDMAPILNALTT